MEAGKKSQSQSYSLSLQPERGRWFVVLTPANLEVPAWKFLPGSCFLNIFP
jgi:hypothetical protein